MNKDKEPLMSAEEWEDKNKNNYSTNYQFAQAYAKYHTEWHKEENYKDMEEYADYCLMCSAEKTFKIPLTPQAWYKQNKPKTCQ